MSIIYTLITKNQDVILADYTDNSGNFQQASLLILKKIKQDKKCTIEYEEYNFYSDDEDGITFLAMMTNGIKEDTAFSYLSEIKKKFLTKYQAEDIRKAIAFQFSSFGETIKERKEFYESNPTHSKTDILMESLNETAEIMRQNYQDLLERDEKLVIIVDKAKNLRSASMDFKRTVFIYFNKY
jgi:vesicle-associated membrane protein 7